MGHKHGYDWHKTMFFSLRQFIYLHISCENQSVERIIAKYVLSNSTLLEKIVPLGAKQLGGSTLSYNLSSLYLNYIKRFTAS